MPTHFDPAGIPAALTAYVSWTAWRYAPNGDAKPKKVPINPATGRAVKSGDHFFGREYASILAYATQYDLGLGSILMPDLGLCCIDIDPPKDTDPDAAEQRANQECVLAAARAAGCLIEASPSGTGWHIWTLCDEPAAHPEAVAGIECYTHNRYLTVTGRQVSGALGPMPAALRALLAPCFTGGSTCAQHDSEAFRRGEEREPVQSNDDVLDMAQRAANAEKFTALWRGEWQQLGYPSQSEADNALIWMLAYYSPSNAQVRELFRQSGLYRPEDRYKASDAYLNRSIKKFRSEEPPPLDRATLEVETRAILARRAARAGIE